MTALAVEEAIPLSLLRKYLHAMTAKMSVRNGQADTGCWHIGNHLAHAETTVHVQVSNLPPLLVMHLAAVSTRGAKTAKKVSECVRLYTAPMRNNMRPCAGG